MKSDIVNKILQEVRQSLNSGDITVNELEEFVVEKTEELRSNTPICFLCLMPMCPTFTEVNKIGERFGRPLLSGYKCPTCREIIANGVGVPDRACSNDELARLKYRIQILEKYQKLMDEKTELPEGYSYP
jgi:hypothetical protein